ncbi:uncharacterized protein BDV17DRAFT_74774 [Aspergillus undulatus]|uniref:uncharacterized protein n=1 Tax=Aspergillus undulatus TaxID=1810928 RepID=UPI003CCCAB0C
MKRKDKKMKENVSRVPSLKHAAMGPLPTPKDQPREEAALSSLKSACGASKNPSDAEKPGRPHEDRAATEYAQPDVSQYRDTAVTVCIGANGVHYTIPADIADQYPFLLYSPQPNGSLIVRLGDVDEDIGHTFMHYLYTGNYETQKPFPLDANSDTTRGKLEFTRSMLAYRAAMTYGLPELAELAQGYMQTFVKHVDVLEMINLARENFPHI